MTDIEQVRHGVRLQYLEVMARYPEVDLAQALEIADDYINGQGLDTNRPSINNPDLSVVTNELHQAAEKAQVKAAASAVKPQFQDTLQKAEVHAEQMRVDPNHVPPHEAPQSTVPQGQPVRYEEMIKTHQFHQPPREENINIARPLNAPRDASGIAETGGNIPNE